MLKEVRIGTFKNDNDGITAEPLTRLELDPNSTMTAVCDVVNDIATDVLGNQYYIVEKDARGRIKQSSLSKITKGIPYVININEKEFSTLEEKIFYENLKKVLEIKNKYMQVDSFETVNDFVQNNKKRR